MVVNRNLRHDIDESERKSRDVSAVEFLHGLFCDELGFVDGQQLSVDEYNSVLMLMSR